jgi:pimeloyl-ACP methyl ester carboxylesterase
MKRTLLFTGLAFAAVLLIFTGVVMARYHFAHQEGSYFDSNGVKIHYVEIGKGIPVILIHGLGVNYGLNWKTPGIMDALARKYRVIALDNRGHGRSDKPTNAEAYGVQMVEDVIRLMDHLKIPRAHIVGYSMGGFITVKLAVTHPDRVISVTPSACGWMSDPSGDLGVVDNVAGDVENGKGYGRLIARLHEKVDYVPAWRILIGSKIMDWYNDRRCMAAALRGMRQLQVTADELRGLKMPCQTVVGSKDAMIRAAEGMVAACPQMKMTVLPGKTHITAVGSKTYREAIEQFLDATSSENLAQTR